MNNIYRSLVLAVFVIATIGCTIKDETTPEASIVGVETNGIFVSKKQFESSDMMEGSLEKRRFERRIRVNGEIAIPSKSKAIVSSMLGGTVGPIDLIQGQAVRKGQRLLRVSNPALIDLQEQYLVLKSKTSYLREEEARKQKLANEDLIGNQDYLLAKAAYHSNIAKYKAVSQKLELYGINADNISSENLRSYIAVVAPISGYVTSITALRGQYIDPATKLVTIANRSDMYLALQVLERDGSLIQEGQKVSYTLSSDPSKLNEATVHLINPSIDNSGMLTVYCKLTKTDNLLPGMYATADLIIESYESDALPQDAMVQIEGKSHVLVQSSRSSEGYQYLPERIEIGRIQDGYVEVKNIEKLQGQNVLVQGGYLITS